MARGRTGWAAMLLASNEAALAGTIGLPAEAIRGCGGPSAYRPRLLRRIW
jgi:hypothetical protein